MIVRPSGVWLDGALEPGLELLIEEGEIREIRPQTGIPEPFVVSPAFVNAHSHLEYYGLMDQVPGDGYWEWISALTSLKTEQAIEDVRRDAFEAAKLNRAGGVGFLAEHSDRPVAGAAMAHAGLPGVVFQEVITVLEHLDPSPKLARIREMAAINAKEFGGPVHLSPHAPYTVDPGTLRTLGQGGTPLSIHVAETEYEADLLRGSGGPIAEFYRRMGVPWEPTGQGVVGYLESLGCVRPSVQFVHGCALGWDELERMARAQVTVAHCPRSNERLGCPDAPVREMLDLGIAVGLGLDSAASGGPIDMFAEMRAALAASLRRGRPVTPEQVWSMGTERGRASVPIPGPAWRIEVGSRVPLIAIGVSGATRIEDVIEAGAPERVRWL